MSEFLAGVGLAVVAILSYQGTLWLLHRMFG